jgi:hypothetical protein
MQFKLSSRRLWFRQGNGSTNLVWEKRSGLFQDLFHQRHAQLERLISHGRTTMEDLIHLRPIPHVASPTSAFNFPSCSHHVKAWKEKAGGRLTVERIGTQRSSRYYGRRRKSHPSRLSGLAYYILKTPTETCRRTCKRMDSKSENRNVGAKLEAD